jgi:hypothetical protein
LWHYAADLAFFGDITDELALALIGSSSSMIGHERRSEAKHSINYYEMLLLDRVAYASCYQKENSKQKEYEDLLGIKTRLCDYERAMHSTALAIEKLPGPMKNVELLAKTIYTDQRAGRLLVVATPIYVALV